MILLYHLMANTIYDTLMTRTVEMCSYEELHDLNHVIIQNSQFIQWDLIPRITFCGNWLHYNDLTSFIVLKLDITTYYCLQWYIKGCIQLNIINQLNMKLVVYALVYVDFNAIYFQSIEEIEFLAIFKSIAIKPELVLPILSSSIDIARLSRIIVNLSKLNQQWRTLIINYVNQLPQQSEYLFNINLIRNMKYVTNEGIEESIQREIE